MISLYNYLQHYDILYASSVCCRLYCQHACPNLDKVPNSAATAKDNCR